MPWGIKERRAWCAKQKRIRDYFQRVCKAITRCVDPSEIQRYGQLEHDFLNLGAYPLLSICTGNLNEDKPNILVTAGVHGHEEGGVAAALRFLKHKVPKLRHEFNFMIFPCINPWAFETNNLFNQEMEDLNMHFNFFDSEIHECTFFMDHIHSLGVRFRLAIDLHETTTKDLLFFQQRALRDGEIPHSNLELPDGFYGIIDPRHCDSKLGSYVIAAVARVAPIASNTEIFGDRNQNGIVTMDEDNVLTSFTSGYADEVLTTEPFRDKLRAVDIECQMAALEGALEYVRKQPTI